MMKGKTMKKVVIFETSVPPGEILLEHFINDIVAFYEVSSLEPKRYLFYYNGLADSATSFLPSIGFKDVRLLREVMADDERETITWDGRTQYKK